MACDINYWHGNALSDVQVTRGCVHHGHISAAGALSHEKLHAVNLIGAPEIRTATSSSPRNLSDKVHQTLFPRRGWVWDRDYYNTLSYIAMIESLQ